ncbi:MAG: LLM class flavin-dependent oxidoreductase [Pseudonocardiales bacterium]|nr:LLM class flavin-dependent oxidoreductase [Pseudonocardiales bacterium]
MKAGIGLPSTIPGVTGADITTWAREAEQHGFSSLAVLDRLVYPNVEPLVALAAAAAVTERIDLITAVLIGPYRANAALLAKQLASIDHLSGGRLSVGIAAGAREDDYAASGVDYESRGQQLDAMLDTFDAVWSSASAGRVLSGIGPKPVHGRPALLFGGTGKAAFRRTATRGDGWIMGGGDASAFLRSADGLSTAWTGAGRTGKPRTAALAYIALGPDGAEQASAYLGDYYRFLGADVAGAIARSAVTTPEAARGRLKDFADAGCDELLFIPCSPDPAQVAALAQAVR